MNELLEFLEVDRVEVRVVIDGVIDPNTNLNNSYIECGNIKVPYSENHTIEECLLENMRQRPYLNIESYINFLRNGAFNNPISMADLKKHGIKLMTVPVSLDCSGVGVVTVQSYKYDNVEDMDLSEYRYIFSYLEQNGVKIIRGVKQ